MKCIHCGTDAKLRDRTGGRCPKCRHPFAFEPTKDSNRVTDGQLKGAVDRVSDQGKLAFTERQLWYEFNHRWMRPGFWRSPYGALPVAGLGPGALAALGVLNVAFFPVAAAGLVVGAGVGAYLSHRANRRAPLPPRPPRIPFDFFRTRYLQVFTQVHGPVAGLLPPREAALLSAPRTVAPDVAAFSFDRALVTDRWETAAMLVANRFHFEHNCAVLSRDGYPDAIGDTVKAMLRRNPRLTVFALHDASPGGCLLPLTLREPEWFPDPGVRVVDLGLRRETVARARIPVLPGRRQAALPPRLGELLPPEDMEWLAEGHSAELAALRPSQILRAAYLGMVAAGPGDGLSGDGGGGTYDGGGVIWVGDFHHHGDTGSVDGFG
jgi:hypothetical protein